MAAWRPQTVFSGNTTAMTTVKSVHEMICFKKKLNIIIIVVVVVVARYTSILYIVALVLIIILPGPRRRNFGQYNDEGLRAAMRRAFQ